MGTRTSEKQLAAKRRKNAAHGASRGSAAAPRPAPKGRKKLASTSSDELRLIPITLDDEIRPGDSLADKLLGSLRKRRLHLQTGDILIIKHKIVSKSEGRIVDLATIDPSKSPSPGRNNTRSTPA